MLCIYPAISNFSYGQFYLLTFSPVYNSLLTLIRQINTEILIWNGCGRNVLQRIADRRNTVWAYTRAGRWITGQITAACTMQWQSFTAWCKVAHCHTTSSTVPRIWIAARIYVRRLRWGWVYCLCNLLFSSSWASDLISGNWVWRRRSGIWNWRGHEQLIGGRRVSTVPAPFRHPTTTGPLRTDAVFSTMPVTTCVTWNSRQRFVGARTVDRPLPRTPHILQRCVDGSWTRMRWRCWPTRMWSTQSTRLWHWPDPARLVGVRRTTSAEHMRHICG